MMTFYIAVMGVMLVSLILLQCNGKKKKGTPTPPSSPALSLPYEARVPLPKPSGISNKEKEEKQKDEGKEEDKKNEDKNGTSKKDGKEKKKEEGNDKKEEKKDSEKIASVKDKEKDQEKNEGESDKEKEKKDEKNQSKKDKKKKEENGKKGTAASSKKDERAAASVTKDDKDQNKETDAKPNMKNEVVEADKKKDGASKADKKKDPAAASSKKNNKDQVAAADKKAEKTDNKASAENGFVIEPKSLNFEKPDGKTQISLTNNTGKRAAVKVRVSDNLVYKIQPVFAFVVDGAKHTIDVERFGPATATNEKIVIVFANCEDHEQDVASVFKKVAPTEQKQITIPIVFAK